MAKSVRATIGCVFPNVLFHQGKIQSDPNVALIVGVLGEAFGTDVLGQHLSYSVDYSMSHMVAT